MEPERAVQVRLPTDETVLHGQLGQTSKKNGFHGGEKPPAQAYRENLKTNASTLRVIHAKCHYMLCEG